MAKRKGNQKKNPRIEGVNESTKVMITLNSQQTVALSAMMDFYQSSEKFFLLSGPGGTGKTFTVQALIQSLRQKKPWLSVAACAPTHKAVKVLQQMTRKWDINKVDASTIHKLMGLEIDYSEEGDRILVEGKASSVGKYSLIIVDEASIISSNFWAMLRESVAHRRTKFVFMGDDAQLPPINEFISPVFEQVLLKAQLTQIMRQTEDNPILDFINATRARVFDPTLTIPLHTQHTGDRLKGVWVFPDKNDWLNHLIKAFKSPKYSLDSSYVRAIAWRNKTVDRINEVVRAALWEMDADCPYNFGERLIAKDAIFDEYGEDLLMNACSEFKVIEATYTTDHHQLNVWKLRVEDDEYRTRRIKVLDSSSQSQFDAKLKELANKAKAAKRLGGSAKKAWSQYWQFRQSYALVRYPYAATAHSSQGDTLSNVFVAYNDILANPNSVERWKCLYVAVSRATDRLFVYA